MAADFNDQLDDHPAARGLQLISRGFPLVTKDDHETAKRASFVYDALCASIKRAVLLVHFWTFFFRTGGVSNFEEED